MSAASFFCQKNRGIGCVFRKNRYLCSATVLRSPPQGADRGDQMGIGCESRTVPAAVCSCFPLRGSERVRHSLATDFRVGKASQTERVRRPAVAIELCSSISRLGNSSKLDCARLDEMVGNLRLRVTGESRKRLLGSNRIEREASPANVRGGTKRLSTIRYSGSEFRGRIFRFGISGPRGERTETYLPTRLSGERRRD
mgnify:CR=1 FL=1